MNYRTARPVDEPAIRRIWRASFPADSEQDITAFLSCTDLERECLLAVDGQPVSMVFMLPARLTVGESALPLQYIYAAATLPERRGVGLFGGLLRQALSLAKVQGCAASFLRPAQPSLADYYARFGYEPFFYCDTLTGPAASLPVSATPVSANDYTRRRQAWLPVCAVQWEPRLLSGTYLLGARGEEGCALCEPRGEVLYVSELLCKRSEQARLCGGLAARFGCKRYRCRVPAQNRAGEPFGLLRPLTAIKTDIHAVPYMGPALD